MKKYIYLSVILLFVCTIKAQDFGSWILPDANDVYRVNFYPDNLVVEWISPYSYPSDVINSDGGYGNDGDLHFYILDKYLYSNSNQLIDTYIHVENHNVSPEVEIIKIPGGLENLYYIIWSCYESSKEDEGYIGYTEVEYNTNNNNVSINNKVFFDNTENGYSGFALTEEENNMRYMYYSNEMTGLCKTEVTSVGIGVNIDIIVYPGDSFFQSPTNFVALNLEIKETNDNKTVLAWITTYINGFEKIFIVTIDNSTITKKIIEPDLGRITGIEFSPVEDNILFFSCEGGQEGIYKININDAIVNPDPVIGYADYQKTFIQLAANGYIYAVSNNGDNLGEYDPVSGVFQSNVQPLGVETFYLIDGIEHYVLPENSRLFSILSLDIDPSPVSCPGYEDGSAIVTVTGGTEPYYYRWYNSDNEIILEGQGEDYSHIENLAEGQYTCCVVDATDEEVCDIFYIILDPELFTYDEWWEVTVNTPGNNLTESFKEGIWISNNAVLTLTDCYFEFGKGARVIIEPGSKLIVDNSTLTHLIQCIDKWQGIEVWGDSDQHQFTFNEQCAQGKLILKDSAIIENAVFAVTLWQPENWNTTGGIVQATDAFFYNNSRTAQFMEYHNIFNGNEYDNQSYFNKCTFEINNDFIVDGQYWYAAQIYMWAVKGIKFKGCTFTNLRDSKPTATAIFTNNSGYKVEGTCNVQIVPCPDFRRSIFQGFNKAIDASNSLNVLYPVSIHESDFTNNVIGIYFKCVNLSTILNNNFSIGYSDVCGYNSGFGIQMINSKGFAIEDNNFMEPTSNPDLFSFGLIIINTNNDYDEVYGNTFNGLFSANYAIEKNWGSSRFKGLAYYCNQNQDNKWDFYVGYGNDDYSGIQFMQGSPTYVTGNTFSTDAVGHFYNDGSHGVGYYYNMNEPAEVPDVNKVFQVTREPVDLVNTCPPHYGGGNIRLSISDKQQRELDFNQAKRNYNIANVQYELLDPVNDSTERKLLEIQMSEFNTQMARAAYDIIRSELYDTLVHYTEVKTWLYNLETYSADEMLIELYMQQGEYAAALALLDSLPQLYSLSAYDSIEYVYYKTLKTMQVSWMGEGRNIFGLNADEITQLASLADSSRGTAGTQAKGILEFAHDYNYQDCPQVAGFGFKSSPAEQKNGEKESDLCISVQPNPAGTLTVFKYTLPEDCAEALLSISDVAGRTIATILCNQAHGRLEWNTNGIEPGLYFYTLSAKGYSKSGKLIINK